MGGFRIHVCAYRMAEFVSKAIDNASHGLTVQAAMQSLGLKEYASNCRVPILILLNSLLNSVGDFCPAVTEMSSQA